MRKYLFLFYFMAIPLIAFANDVSIDGITYVLDEESKTAEVKSTDQHGTLVIPETIEYNKMQYSVTSIGDLAFYQKNIWCYLIPKTVNKIGQFAFAGLTGFSNCTIYLLSESVVSSEKNVFKDSRVSSMSLRVPEQLVEDYKSTSPWNEIGEISALSPRDVVRVLLKCGYDMLQGALTQSYYLYGGQVTETDMGYPQYMIAATEMLGDMFPAGGVGYDWFIDYNTSKRMGADGRCAYTQWYTLVNYIKLINSVIGQVAVYDKTEFLDDFEIVKLWGSFFAYRALFYYMMTVFYEAVENPYTDCSKVKGLTVPIVTETTEASILNNNPRATHREMVDFILHDLDIAEEAENTGEVWEYYITISAIYGLKARVYLWDEDYANAAKYARKAIDSWTGHPMTAEEWEDPYSAFATFGKPWVWVARYDYDRIANLCNLVGWLSGEESWGYSSLTHPSIDRALYDKINKSDFRKHVFLDPEKYNYYEYKTVRDRSFIENAPAYLSMKFRCCNGYWESYSNGGVTEIPLMRIEEMYLIEAEALGVLEGVGNGMKKLNEFMNTYRDPEYSCFTTNLRDFQLEVLTQMRIEFWGEGIAFPSAKRLRAGVMQNYTGTNAPNDATKINCEVIKPNWNFVIPTQAVDENSALVGMNNPDPSDAIKGPSPINEYSSGPYSTGIVKVNDNSAKVAGYYTLDGKRINSPGRGLNIVKMSDGSTKKVIK